MLGSAALCCLTSPAIAQQATGSFGSGVGRLEVDRERSALPYTSTAQGVVVALEPIVARLGGELEVGPLLQSHKLELYGEEIILGPESTVMTIGERIVPLSRAPLAGLDGRIEVPIDFLELSYGDLLGYRFDWSSSTRSLEVLRSSRRRLPVEIDRVQISSTTTVVLRFSERPRYRWVEGDGYFDILIPGDLLEVEGRLPKPDSLVLGVEVERDRVRVRLSPDAQAAEPYLVSRGRRAQLVVDVSRRRSRITGSRPTGLRPTDGGFSGMKIVIDPGHGGGESGAVGASGTLEKDLTIQLARTLKRRLEAQLPVRVILTRDADTELDLVTRTAIANQNQASLFISLHLNSEPRGGGARGAETFFLDQQATDEAAAAAAEFENRASSGSVSRASDDLQLMLWDLAQSRHLAESQRLAKLVQEELNQALGIRNRGVKQAPFTVLMGATMPAILVELGFLSNQSEEQSLLDPGYRIQLVDALVDAIARYRTSERSSMLGASSPQGVRP